MKERDLKKPENSKEKSASYRISPAVIKRLPRYFRYLRELLETGRTRISSGELSKMMSVTASQIRQDLNCFGGFGQQGYGYNVEYLYGKISEILGVDEGYRAVIVGAGHLGKALMSYVGFKQYGLEIIAAFDSDPSLWNTAFNGITVFPPEKMADIAERLKLHIGIITVPAPHAQEVCDRLVEAGVRAIWNFAPVDLVLPEGVAVNNVHLSDSLHILSYRMNEKELFSAIDASKQQRD